MSFVLFLLLFLFTDSLLLLSAAAAVCLLNGVRWRDDDDDSMIVAVSHNCPNKSDGKKKLKLNIFLSRFFLKIYLFEPVCLFRYRYIFSWCAVGCLFIVFVSLFFCVNYLLHVCCPSSQNVIIKVRKLLVPIFYVYMTVYRQCVLVIFF